MVLNYFLQQEIDKMDTPHWGHAIVVGGSMAGLVTARALADHFARVTVIDRDHLPAGPLPRPGVPQARHVHILLLRGQALLEQWFPGLEDELGAQGAPRLDVTQDGRWLNRAGWGPVFACGRHGRVCSRDLREWAVRRRLRALPGVRFREEWDVVGLLADPTGACVIGVRVRPRGQAIGSPPAEEDLAADLVVDASGRGSRAPAWLEALGYARPGERMINSFLGYGSRYYTPPPDWAGPWQGLYIQPAPPTHLRGGGIYRVEGGRWLVTLVGAGGDYPPTADPEFLAFARSLRSPALYEALRHAQPLSPIVGYRGTANRWRAYERLARRPEQFVVLGDAACAFNPVYGQGMTAAALGAAVLASTLCEQRRRYPNGDLRGLAGRFQHQLARHNQPLWALATLEDLRCPQTVGRQPTLGDRLAHHYMDRVLRRSTTDRAVYLTLVEVLQLLQPLHALVGPGMLGRVLRPGDPRSPEAGPGAV
jgi:2-polyprenyl-6-methoxyphenol hydroxylase-like FAD-dependent oxidoreductase